MLCVTLRVFVCTVVVVLYSKKAPAVRHCLFHCLSSCHHIIYPLSSQPVIIREFFFKPCCPPLTGHTKNGTLVCNGRNDAWMYGGVNLPKSEIKK